MSGRYSSAATLEDDSSATRGFFEGGLHISALRLARNAILSAVLVMTAAVLVVPGARAQSPLQISATHQIVSVNTDADGVTWLTVAITVQNDSTTYLTGANLQVMGGPPFDASELENGPAVGDVAAGTSVTVNWTGRLIGPFATDDPALVQLDFSGSATDDFGEPLGFPVHSLEGAL